MTPKSQNAPPCLSTFFLDKQPIFSFQAMHCQVGRTAICRMMMRFSSTLVVSVLALVPPVLTVQPRFIIISSDTNKLA
jgi:hypothetical protein